MLDEWDFLKWNPIVQLFLSLCHRKYGHLINLPTSGGYLEQPSKLMELLNITQIEFFKFIEEENKKASQP